MRRITIATLIALTALLLGACGGDDAAPDAEASGAVALEAGDLYFDPDTATARAGTVEVTLTNVGAVEHDYVIEELGTDVIVHVDPGETASGSVDLDAGTYTFYCAIPGHRAAGMEGTLTVQ